MGGYGSGRPGWKDKVEDLKSLDIGGFRRAGYLQPGRTGTWGWWRGGEKIGWIEVRSVASAVILSYRWRWHGGDWKDCEERVPVEWVPCTLGGARPYFRCPGIVNGRHCGRRVGKLFAGGQYFLCRHCYRLAYSSQSEEPMHRHNRRANKIRMALGGEPGTGSLPPRKPKGMHWRTFWRKMDAIDAADAAGDIAFMHWAHRRFPGMGLDDLLG